MALSSRNQLLSEQERKLATNIFKYLDESRALAKEQTVEQVHDYVVDSINAIEGLKVEYFEIVDGNTLLSVSSWDDSDYVVGCITVYCGAVPVRLIDHIKY